MSRVSSYLFLWMMALLSACQPNVPASPTAEKINAPRYAQRWGFEQHGGQTRVRVGGNAYPKPAKSARIVCTSTIQAAMLRLLGEENRIVGMVGGQYLYDSLLYARFRSGQIADLGRDGRLDLEKTLALQPDLILANAGSPETKLLQRAESLGIAVWWMEEQLEANPLGRAEWVRVLGWGCGVAAKADSIFAQQVEAPYLALRETVLPSHQPRPTVFTGIAYEGTWYAAGGRSFVAAAIAEAGGDYLWRDDPKQGGLPLAWEAVWAKARRADVWLNVSEARSLAELRAMDARYADFEAFARKRVYSYHRRVSPNGGFDIFESGVVQPHRVLADLQTIFYPNVSDTAALYYYMRVE